LHYSGALPPEYRFPPKLQVQICQCRESFAVKQHWYTVVVFFSKAGLYSNRYGLNSIFRGLDQGAMAWWDVAAGNKKYAE
jgi:hypothetical protein